MRLDRGRGRAAPAQRGQLRARLVAGRLTIKVYFDGGCRPNPGAISVAAVIRGIVDRRDDVGVGSSGDAEWLALLHALDVALAAGATDVILLGDSAATIDQANGRARKRCAPEVQVRFDELCTRFDRLRFRRIKRTQNLAGIALDQICRRSPQ
jgi:ribonuclease HI